MSEFFVPDSSPIFSYSAKDGRQDWKQTYAMQRDSFDQSLHSTVFPQSSISFNISATRLTIQVPSFAGCTSIISINESIPATACSSPSTLFTLDGLPAGLHRVTFGVGDITQLVGGGDDLVFWGVAGVGPKRPENVRNMTIDNMYQSRPASSDGSVQPLELNFSSEWRQATPDNAGAAQAALSEDDVHGAFNKSLAVTSTKGARMTLRGQGSAIYIYGNTGPDYGSASVTINGVTVASRLNLTNGWNSGYNLLWFQDGLDNSEDSTMVLTNLEDRQIAVDFLLLTADEAQVHAITTVASKPGFLSTTAGKAVVCGVLPLVVCLLGGLLAFLIVRRRKSRRPRISIPSNDGEKSKRDSTQSFSDQQSGSVFYSYNASDDHRRESAQTGSDRSRSDLLSPADSYKMATLGQVPFRQRSGEMSPDSDVSPSSDRTYQLPYERTAQRSSAGSSIPHARPAAPTFGGSQTSAAFIDGRIDTLASLTGTDHGSLVRIIQEAIAIGGAMSPRSTVPPAYSSGVSPVEAAAAREKFGDIPDTVPASGAGPSAWDSRQRDDDFSRHSAVVGRRVGAPSIISMMGAPPSLARMSTASSATGLPWEEYGSANAPPVPSRTLALNTNLRPASFHSATAESLLEPRSTTTSDFHRKADWPVPPPVPTLPMLQTNQSHPRSETMSINASVSGAARPDSQLYHYDSPLGSIAHSPFASTPSPSAGRLLKHRASSSFAGSPGTSPSPGLQRRLSFGSLSRMPAARVGAGLLTPTVGSDRDSTASPVSETLSPKQIRNALRLSSLAIHDSDYRGSDYSSSSGPAPPIDISALSQRKLDNPAAFRFSAALPQSADGVSGAGAASRNEQGGVKSWKDAMKRKVGAAAESSEGGSSFLSLGKRQENRI